MTTTTSTGKPAKPYPSRADVDRFLRNLRGANPSTGTASITTDGPARVEKGGVTLQRLAFTRVDGRRTNGHVQGIAARFTEDAQGRREVSVYASLSDFPPGWGACLIERGTAHVEHTTGMEAMSIPQGRHPGGINICDDLLVIPVEHDGRQARLYFYGLAIDPLYPRQVGHFDPDAPAVTVAGEGGHQGTAQQTSTNEVWRILEGDKADKASAAGIAEMPDGWIPSGDQPPIDGDRRRYLVAVLAEKRYLRFLEFVRHGTNEVKASGCWATCDLGEQSGFVDNVSLIRLDDGAWGLFIFSADNLRRGVGLQREDSTDRVIFRRLAFEKTGDPKRFEVRFDPATDDDEAVVAWRQPGPEWPDGLEYRIPGSGFEQCWPGFRWGASVTWTGSDLGLFMAEWFGDEEAWTDNEERAGGVMYVQFATDLDQDPFGFTDGRPHFGAAHAAAATKPPPHHRAWRNLRDAIPVVHMGVKLGGRWLEGLALLGLALIVLGTAIAVPGLTLSLFLAGVGSLAGLIAIGMFSVGVSEVIGDDPGRASKAKRWAGVAVPVAATLAALGFVAERRSLVALLAPLALLATGVVYDVAMRPRLRRFAEAASTTPRADAGLAAGLLVGAVIAALGAEAIRSGDVLLLPPVAVTLLILLAAIKFVAWPILGVPGSDPFSWVKAIKGHPLASAGVVVGGAVGAGSLVLAGRMWAAAGFGAWLVLALASIWGAVEYERPRPSRRYRLALAILATILILGALLATLEMVPDAPIAFFVIAITAIAGAFVVWPGEAGLVMVVVIFIATWAAADLDHRANPGDPTAAVAEDEDVRWVAAIGDSFISGEGASSFHAGTNIPGVNVCRRAPTAWPELVTRQLGRLGEAIQDQPDQARLASFACSGATIANIIDTPQHDGLPIPGNGVDPASPNDFNGTVTQLDAFVSWLEDDQRSTGEVAYVLISVGGNDAGFAKVIAACLTPSDISCADTMKDFEKRAGSVEDDLKALLDEVEAALLRTDHRPTIIINPYLDPMGDGDGPRCGTLPGRPSLITADEVTELTSFRQTLNSRIRAAVDRYNEPAKPALTVLYNDGGARVAGNLCGGATSDGEIRQNWLVLQPPDDVGDGPFSKFLALVPSDSWVLGSVHPNASGHAAIAETVCGLVNEHEGVATSFLGCRPPQPSEIIGFADGVPELEEVEPPPASECVSSDGSAEPPCPEARESTEAWVDDRLAEAARGLGTASAVGALGGVLLGSWTAHHPRIRRRDNEPVTTKEAQPKPPDPDPERAA